MTSDEISQRFKIWSIKDELDQFLEMIDDPHFRRVTKMYIVTAFKKGYENGETVGRNQLLNAIERFYNAEREKKI